MNIDEQWKNANEEADANLSAMLNPAFLKNAHSKDPLAALRKNIIANTAWAILISAGYTAILILYPYWQLLLCLGITLLASFAGVITNVYLYRKITRNDAQHSLLDEMERYYYAVKAWMKSQERAMLFVYPFAAAGGFMFGLSLTSGRSIEEMMQRTVAMVAFIVLIIVLVPAGYYLGKYLNRKAFGKYCDQLKQNIDALKAE